MAVPTAEIVADKGLDIAVRAIAVWAGMQLPQLQPFAKLLGMPDDVRDDQVLADLHRRVLVAFPEGDFEKAVNSWDASLIM